ALPSRGAPVQTQPLGHAARRSEHSPDQQWFGLGPRKWASKLAVNDPGWNPGEISRKSPALQGLGI
ncbi:MAG: hypothetical protein ACXU95_12160, partial [Isosphaeraceae bacterium]